MSRGWWCHFVPKLTIPPRYSMSRGWWGDVSAVSFCGSQPILNTNLFPTPHPVSPYPNPHFLCETGRANSNNQPGQPEKELPELQHSFAGQPLPQTLCFPAQFCGCFLCWFGFSLRSFAVQHLCLFLVFLLSLRQWEGIKHFDPYPHFSLCPEDQPQVSSPWGTTPQPAPSLPLCPISWGHLAYVKQGAARSRCPGLRTNPGASPGRAQSGTRPGTPRPDPLLSQAWPRPSPLGALRPGEALRDQPVELGGVYLP